jgi:Flp pilus assembly protein TadD
VRLNPADGDAFYNRAILRQSQGDSIGAREDYDSAIRLNPNDAQALKNRAVLRRAQGDIAGARQDFEMAQKVST